MNQRTTEGVALRHYTWPQHRGYEEITRIKVANQREQISTQKTKEGGTVSRNSASITERVADMPRDYDPGGKRDSVEELKSEIACVEEKIQRENTETIVLEWKARDYEERKASTTRPKSITLFGRLGVASEKQMSIYCRCAESSGEHSKKEKT
ncbi:hypothetical protein KQX54_000722 [Cotesia glomerata]|uniref:Uncharacterized protein n=1 Tax=Cotesia glomerata TaxID=32391 RepID=A0AAV7ITF7_COTGL|nr:hypothetical protein KQX54_000722 [Cotesia glomerata]